MASVGLTNSLAASQFDFTNLTRSQALSAGQTLFDQGKITGRQKDILEGFSVDYAPGLGQQVPASEGLTSDVSRNYLQLIQNQIAELKSVAGGDSSLQQSLAGDQNLLQALAPYQSQAAASYAAQKVSSATLDLLG